MLTALTLTSTGAFTMSPLLDAAKLLGFSTAIVAQTSVTATYAPAHLVTFVERVSADWTPRTAVAGAETLAGVGYGVQVGTWREEDEIAFGYIPRDVTARTALSLEQSPFARDAGSTYGTTPAVWSVWDFLREAGGVTCAAALGTWTASSAVREALVVTLRTTAVANAAILLVGTPAAYLLATQQLPAA